ncbi:hypothetical protein TNIN_457761 [Trichonephila inaurata madagascariensis]|uniref:Uncharacterized protein n=1 Tax=Trichonephila inaurata madagascariensis TaxID=2747483 RepID=A0A8X6XP96_9ARAC|nr:hypothetical protein TNIN_457761 [Trichonephila inaurata madagascariensis]
MTLFHWIKLANKSSLTALKIFSRALKGLSPTIYLFSKHHDVKLKAEGRMNCPEVINTHRKDRFFMKSSFFCSGYLSEFIALGHNSFQGRKTWNSIATPVRTLRNWVNKNVVETFPHHHIVY